MMYQFSSAVKTLSIASNLFVYSSIMLVELHQINVFMKPFVLPFPSIANTFFVWMGTASNFFFVVDVKERRRTKNPKTDTFCPFRSYNQRKK